MDSPKLLIKIKHGKKNEAIQLSFNDQAMVGFLLAQKALPPIRLRYLKYLHSLL